MTKYDQKLPNLLPKLITQMFGIQKMHLGGPFGVSPQFHPIQAAFLSLSEGIYINTLK